MRKLRALNEGFLVEFVSFVCLFTSLYFPNIISEADIFFPP